MQLRPNQENPVSIGIEYFRNEKNPVPSIIVAPTAFGKSVVIAKIAESVEGKLLILQPSKELLEQNYAKYTALDFTYDMFGEKVGTAAIYSASFGSKKISEVTYATIGSIQKIGKRFKELGFKKMIIDEAHLYPRDADSMLGRFLKDSEITHVLGLTATPLKLQTNRDLAGNSFSKLQMLTSRSKKGNFFKDIISVSQVSEMVDLKFWAKLEYEQYDIDESGLVYNSTKAEFTEESIKKVYETNDVRGKIEAKLDQMHDRKSIICFVPSVAEAIHFAKEIPNSVAIYGDMPAADRDYAVTAFKAGRIRTVFNVNVLSVGFDHPQLDAIICARSTASLAWFYQALGRGTRIADGKKDCLIVDFSGNVKRFGKLEYFTFTKEANTWKLYGEGGKLLSGIPLHEIGKYTQETENTPKVVRFGFGMHKGKEPKDVPKSYRDWALQNVTWNSYNEDVKAEIERLAQLQTA